MLAAVVVVTPSNAVVGRAEGTTIHDLLSMWLCTLLHTKKEDDEKEEEEEEEEEEDDDNDDDDEHEEHHINNSVIFCQQV